MAIICSSTDAPAGITVNPTPDPISGACTYSISGGSSPEAYTFTVTKTDDETGEVVEVYEENLVISGGETSTVTLAEPDGLLCDAQSLRVNLCDSAYVFADWDADRVVEANWTPEIVGYETIEPDAADALCVPGVDADGKPDGRMPLAKYALNLADGCITHIAVCGLWYPIGSAKDVNTLPGFDVFCLPDDLTYPLLVDSTTSSITIGGVEYPFDLEPEPKREAGCAFQYEKFAWGNSTGTPLPDIRPPTVLIQGGSGDYCETVFGGGHDPASGPDIPQVAYAFSYPVWSTTGGTCTTQDTDCIYLGFDLNTTVSDIGVGLKVRNSVVWANVVSVTPPPGAVLGTHYTVHPGHVRIQNPVSPVLPIPQRWELKFEPQAATPANGSFDSLFWAMTGPDAGASDRIARMRMTVEGPPIEPAYSFGSATELAAEINSVDPNSAVTWVVRDGQVCAHAPIELGGDYTPPNTSLNI